MNYKSKEVLEAEAAMRKVNEIFARIEKGKSGQGDIRHQETEELEEAASKDKTKLAEFREAIIEEEALKRASQSSSRYQNVRREIEEEVDRALFEALKANNVSDFLTDVAMAPLIGREPQKGQLLQWVYDYKPGPKRS